ncbi:uncharacterized protein LOC109596127 isoform X2 [Aethina tumida]|uniref:uncharacterized protein LOC109596127 isoform X2 n=1 Tax=Aethina tumida TaxID=116153 RepID=UPI00096B53D4|nr:uncharacterized protein LOC109596127 isoform X2 [Aethina tumida]
MRASFNLLCAATLMFALASCAELNNEATGTGNYYGDAGRSLEPLNVAADPETINYLLPRLTAKYRPNNDWTGVTDPRFYLLTEMESNDIDNQVSHIRKRADDRAVLSIQAPVRALYDSMQKNKMRKLLLANRQLLNNLRDQYN